MNLNVENTKAQMRKGVLEYCILSLLSGEDLYPGDIIGKLKEAKLIVQRFRAAGFDTQAVNEFIDHHAPEALRSDLRRFWQEDLLHEAQEQLADTDPNWPDSHMERAIEYLRKTCHAKWKGRS